MGRQTITVCERSGLVAKRLDRVTSEMSGRKFAKMLLMKVGAIRYSSSVNRFRKTLQRSLDNSDFGVQVKTGC